MPRRLLKKICPSPGALQKRWYLRLFGDRIADPRLWTLHRRAVTTAFGAGLAICFIPLPIHMLVAGLIAITLVLDGKGRPAADAAVLAEGMPQAVESAVQAVVGACLRRHNPKKSDTEELRETVRRAARRAALDAWGKKPVTRVTVVEL